MVAGRIASPEEIVDGKGYNGERKPGTLLGFSKKPLQSFPVQAIDKRVVLYVKGIVEIDEPAPQ
jgi:hypothetical protein